MTRNSIIIMAATAALITSAITPTMAGGRPAPNPVADSHPLTRRRLQRMPEQGEALFPLTKPAGPAWKHRRRQQGARSHKMCQVAVLDGGEPYNPPSG
jgi:hypothetical protein